MSGALNWERVRAQSRKARRRLWQEPDHPLSISLERPGQRGDRPVEAHGQFYCPVSGHLLLVKEGRFGAFWGCIGYSNCTYTFDYDSERSIVSTPR